VFENFEMPPTTAPPYLSLFFPITLGGYHRIKKNEKESLNRVFLDRRLYWYQAHTHSALRHVDPDSNESHVLQL
jgi:hypothetical protein